jgi:hypothetical protein
MSRFVFFLLISFFMIGCSGNKVPKNVLPQKKMEAVLWDVLLADQTAEYYIQKDSSINALQKHVGLYQQLFQIHKISKEDFKRSLQFYESHPQLLKPVLDSLQKRSERSIQNVKPVSVS